MSVSTPPIILKFDRHERGAEARSLVVQRLPGMLEVQGSIHRGGNILCSLCPSEETINRGPNTPIPTTHALICDELKDSGIPPKVVL